MSFSKNDTSVVKGMAILMLIAYHCFSSVERFSGYPVSFLFLQQDAAIYIFETMNICVGMFAFLSAYGLTKSYMSAQRKSPLLSAGQNTAFVVKRWISLIGAFILPAVLCIVATAFITPDFHPYGKGFAYVLNMITDLLGLSGLLGSNLFIGTWWYMSFAAVIIFLIPFTVKLYDKLGWLVLIPYAILPVLLFPDFYSARGLTNMTRWMLVVPLGVIFAKLDLLDRMKNLMLIKNRYINKLIKFVIAVAVICAFTYLRTSDWGKDYVFYFISALFPIYFIYFIYEFICPIPVVKTVLAYFGRHSSNIFYMHTFIRSVWLKDFTYGLNSALLIFLFMVAASLAMSYAVIFIKYITRYEKGQKYLSEKISAFFEKMSVA